MRDLKVALRGQCQDAPGRDAPGKAGLPGSAQAWKLRGVKIFPRVLLPAGLMMLVSACANGPAGWPAPSAGNLEKWEKDIAAFEAANRTNPPPRGAVLFVGSSTIRRWDSLAADFPGQAVINRGFGGSQIADSTAFAHRLITPHRPRLVVLYAGDNDLNAGKSPEQVLADFRSFVATLRAGDPEVRVLFLAIKPSPKRWHLIAQGREANRLIANFCRRDRRLTFVDTASVMIGPDGRPREELFVEDKLHLSEAGYALWAAKLRPHLK
jgi:lysophospholipase L1-like esterase